MTPAPRVELELAPTVPGAAVRLLPGALMVGCAALLAPPTGGWALVLAAACAVTWRPRWPGVALFTLVTGFLVLSGPDLLAPGGGSGAPGGVRLALLVLGLHLVHRTGALAGRLSWTGRVEVAVLATAARSAAAVQLAAQAMLLLAARLRVGFGEQPGTGWLRTAAVCAVVAVALLVLPREWRTRLPRTPQP
jgi:hypothetical protein